MSRKLMVVALALAVVALALALAGCGVRTAGSGAAGSGPGGAGTAATATASSTPAAAANPLGQAHPQAVEPTAGAAASAGGGVQAPSAVSVGPPNRPLPQPLTNSAIRQQLAASGLTASANQATLTPDGLAIAPLDAPPSVQAIIAAGNEIARLPYRYGGGHITYEDTAYDCSGSISFVFDAAHLLSGSVVSGQLEHWGKPGPGKWITIFANAGHTFMYVAGLRFDTVALAETGSRWSNRPADEPDLKTFWVRHPPGL